jgi:hypothetical protein
LKCSVQFPQVVKGRFRVESPAGAAVADEPFESNAILREYALTQYSVYILVDGGVSASGTPPGTERRGVQSVYVTVTPGAAAELKNDFRESPAVSTSTGVSRELRNKFRTVVSVSVG